MREIAKLPVSSSQWNPETNRRGLRLCFQDVSPAQQPEETQHRQPALVFRPSHTFRDETIRMKKAYFLGSLAAALMAGDGAWAAKAPALGDTTWELDGAYDVSYSYNCAVGGHGTGKKTVRLPSQRNLNLNVQFNPDKTFSISGDTLALGVGAITGDWRVKGRKLSFTYDDQTNSYIYQQSKYFQDYSKQLSGSGSAGGGSYSYKFSPVKYSFTGGIDAKGNTLTFKESAGFKVTAKASFAGQSNTCTYQWTMGRKYTGHKVQ
jgi:hypothetical protein